MSEALAVKEETAVQPTNMLQVIAEAVNNPDLDVEKMERLLAMHERITAEQRRQSYQDALSRVQHAIPRVSKDGLIPKGGGGIPFARFEDIQAVTRPLLKDEGFSTNYHEEIVEGMPGIKRVTVTLSRGGYSESCSTFVPIEDAGPGRNKAQAMVSANSYGKRRALVNILDITMEGEDDDGEGGLEPISEEQVLDLQSMIDELKANQDGFLKYMGVASLAEILTKDYQRAVNALETKRRNK